MSRGIGVGILRRCCGSPRKSASQAQGSVSVSGNEVRDQPSRSMLALGELDPARQQPGHERRGHEARRHVSGAQLACQAGHLVVGLRDRARGPARREPGRECDRGPATPPRDAVPGRSTRRGRPARSRDCPGRPATASRTSGPADRAAGGAVACSSGPAARARSPRRESKSGLSSPRSSTQDSTPARFTAELYCIAETLRPSRAEATRSAARSDETDSSVGDVDQ